jgi:hypothetical protein
MMISSHCPDESDPLALHSTVADAGLEEPAAHLAFNHRPTASLSKVARGDWRRPHAGYGVGSGPSGLERQDQNRPV